MSQTNRTVRAALVTVAALTGGLMTLASAQTTPSMSMAGKTPSMPMKKGMMMTPTKAQCMTAKYKNTAACKKMMMMKSTK